MMEDIFGIQPIDYPFSKQDNIKKGAIADFEEEASRSFLHFYKYKYDALQEIHF